MRKKKTQTDTFFRETKLRTLFVSVIVAGTAGTISAQQPAVLEEVVVTGTRQVIQDQIAIRRSAVQIVDGLSASDIGDLPALSIGEALESISGASSHRENGGATEISIRGLGPFLSATHFNGREATNGSGDRSVNFSQFPSELMSKLAISKSQNASMIEGGVAGVIQLETLKPLDYDKRRFQFDLKGNYNPDQQNVSDSQEGDLGHRATASYVDQFEFSNGSALGISIGYQDSAISQPEAEVRSSSPTGTSRFACINDPSVTDTGYYATNSEDDCEDNPAGSGTNGGYDTSIDPETGLAVSDGLAYAWAPSSRGYRTNDTSDTRESFFFAAQFQPNEDWDINFDIERSERTQAEERHDLNFANQKRNTFDVTAPGLVTTDSGAVLAWEGDTAIESNSELFDRTEKYNGGGLNFSYAVNDRLTWSADLAYSKTTRVEEQISVRARSSSDLDSRQAVTWDRRDSGIPQYTVQNFDITDHNSFNRDFRARLDTDVDRENTISSFRTDFNYEIGGDLITSVETGVRYSKLEYLNLGADRRTVTSPSGDDALAINAECAIAFPEDNFLSSLRDGALVTELDDTGSVVNTTNSWATFDNLCVTQGILSALDEEFFYPDLIEEDGGTTDVTESTNAIYAQANFETAIGDTPFRGNFGLRAVNTRVDSIGYRQEYAITEADDGTLSILATDDDTLRVSATSSYTELLPSFTYVLDVSDEVIVRGGIFRGLSRQDPSRLGFNRQFTLNTSEDVTDVNELITDVSGSGNPATDPLTSWNLDTAFEWYPNDDSYLAISLYYKKFTGGFDQVTALETFIVDGEQVEAEFTSSQTTDNESDLYGVELTGSHRFSYLPGALSGLGFKANYNYSDSNFEFEDSLYGDTFVTDVDGNTVQTNIGIIPPGNIPGFSENVFSGQVYYQIGEFDIAAIYKYRSEYFQPYTSNGTRLRYVGDVGVWEARASYKINDNFTVKLEAINLFDEPKEQYFYVDDELGEVNSYGARIFAGITAKF